MPRYPSECGAAYKSNDHLLLKPDTIEAIAPAVPITIGHAGSKLHSEPLQPALGNPTTERDSTAEHKSSTPEYFTPSVPDYRRYRHDH
jgi:hypothetical protein